jgi:hypothetical protein
VSADTQPRNDRGECAVIAVRRTVETVNPGESFLTQSGISFEEIEELVEENPSLRSFISGYVAERRLRDLLFAEPGQADDLGKPDDHDRSETGDRRFSYRNHLVRIESKSVQTNTVKHLGDGRITACAQVDGSDCRDRELPGGVTIRTTCLPVASFDIIAVNCFPVFADWRFAFARADQLARTSHNAYPAAIRKHLLKSSQTLEIVDGSFTGVWHDQPWTLVEELIAEGKLPRKP